MTVKELLTYIEKNNVSMDAEVLVERIHDVYFEKHNWKPEKRKGFMYYQVVETIEKANGEYNDKEEYPRLTQDSIDKMKVMNPDEFMDEYIKTNCATKFKEDNNLYIAIHY